MNNDIYDIDNSKLVNNSPWLYRNITGKKGVPFSKFRKIRDETQILDILTIKQPLEKKDYLEKKLANVKKREEYVDLTELKTRIKNLDSLEKLNMEIKSGMKNTLNKKNPKYSYLTNTEMKERNFKNGVFVNNFFAVPSTPRKKSLPQSIAINEENDSKNKIRNMFRKKYPKYAYLIKNDKKEETVKNNETSATPQSTNYDNETKEKIQKVLDVLRNDNKSRNIENFSDFSSFLKSRNPQFHLNNGNNTSAYSNTLANGNTSTYSTSSLYTTQECLNTDSETEDEVKIDFNEKYSNLTDPNKRKNVVKKEPEAVKKIIQVSNDLITWADENLSNKKIEPLNSYLKKTGYNISEDKNDYKVLLPSVESIMEEDEKEESDNLNDNKSQSSGNLKKDKKPKKENEFDILLNACRLTVLDSKPPMPIKVTEEHDIPYEYIKKIANNLGVDITKIKQSKNNNRMKYIKKH